MTGALFKGCPGARACVLLPLTVWLVLVIGSAWWNLNSLNADAYRLAAERGRHMLRLVEMTRNWNSQHGGVYVRAPAQAEGYPNDPEHDLHTTDGIRLVRINPALMTRQIAELANGDDSRFHITSLNPLRSENAPDPWETRALLAFEAGAREFFELQNGGDRARFRFMAPLLVEASCLECHAEQGYRVGDVRGGISLSMSAQSIHDAQAGQRRNLLLLHGLVFLLVAVLIYRHTERNRRHLEELAAVRDAQDALITRRTAQLERANRRLESEIESRERARTEIHEAWRELDELVEWAPDAMLTATPDGRILRVNAQAEELFGYRRDELADLRVVKLIPERFRQRHQAYWAEFFANPGQRHAGASETLTVLAKGRREIPVEIGLNHLSREGRSLAIVTVRDATERKRYEEDLRHAKDEAEAANRAKSSFLANMSHEIRTPMNAILGIGYLLRNSVLAPAQQRYVDKIQVSARTLLRLLNDILDLSKVEAGRLELENMDFALDQVMDQVATIVDVAARDKGIELVIEVAEDTPETLKGDPLRLQQVLINLASNGVKFTERGRVTVRVAPVVSDADQVQLRFQVRDTGIGISDQQQRRLFRAFAQADSSTTRRFGGTGLGLAISRHLVKLMGGELQVQSEAGKGSVFSFTARFAPGDPAAVTTEYAPGDRAFAERRLQGVRLLLVEDDRVNQEVTREILGRVGAEAVCVDSGEEALQRLEQPDHGFDGVLMDVHMPGMDGFETSRRIRRHFTADALPIVALTASTLADERERCLSAGMNDFVAKPIELEKLLGTLYRWMNPGQATERPPLPEPAAGADVFSAAHPLIDAAVMRRRLAGNEALFRRLLAGFAQTHGDSAVRLREAVSGSRMDEAARLAHTLKGVGGNLAANELRDAAANTESLLRAGDAAAALESLDAVESAVMALLDLTDGLAAGG